MHTGASNREGIHIHGRSTCVAVSDYHPNVDVSASIICKRGDRVKICKGDFEVDSERFPISLEGTAFMSRLVYLVDTEFRDSV